MSSDEEKRNLIDGKESPPPYSSEVTEPHDPEEKDAYVPQNTVLVWFYDHRASIPGYGMVKLVRAASMYSLYVLGVLLMASLINQLDRYTLPIVTSTVGYDLKYGDLVCMKSRQTPSEVFHEYNISSDVIGICTKEKYFDEETNETLNVKHNQTNCEAIIFYNETDYPYHVCEFSYSGKGLTYQIVAGPVFNNLYVLAGLFTGFLADYGHRTIWLAISLFFWSAITGVTGFARAFWHLVVLRALLAIGAAGCNPFAVSLIGDYFPMEVRGTAISIYYFGIYIGYSLAFAIGSSIEHALSWRWVFFICGLVGLAVVPIVIFSVREPKRKKNPLADKTDEQKKLPIAKRFLILFNTFVMPGMFVLLIAGGVRNAGGYVWAYNTELFFEASGYTADHIKSFMSWIPLVGGSIGAVVGGIISDVLVKGRGPYMRIWVLIVSQILAAPFAAGALFLPNPWCFLTLILSNIIGEMWIGVTSAIIVDLAPSKVRTAALAIYLFVITVIGGNFNLLVEPLRSAFPSHYSDLATYRWALFFTFPGVYALSSVLFLLAFFLMRLDLKRKARLEETMLVNEGSGGVTKPHGVADSSGDEVGPLETSYSGEETN